MAEEQNPQEQAPQASKSPQEQAPQASQSPQEPAPQASKSLQEPADSRLEVKGVVGSSEVPTVALHPTYKQFSAQEPLPPADGAPTSQEADK